MQTETCKKKETSDIDVLLTFNENIRISEEKLYVYCPMLETAT